MNDKKLKTAYLTTGNCYRYTELVHLKILEYALRGYCKKDIAVMLGVTEATLHRWFKKFPKLKNDFEAVNKQVELSIVERGYRLLAMGTAVTEETREYFEDTLDAEGNKIGQVKITKKTKILPPDPKALAVIAKRVGSDYIAEDSKDINITINKITEANKAISIEDKLKIIQADYVVKPSNTEGLEAKGSALSVEAEGLEAGR